MTPENQYTARLIHVGVVYSDRLWDVEFGTFSTPEAAYAAAFEALKGHGSANRIWIMKGERDSYDGSFNEVCVAQYDFDRRVLDASSDASEEAAEYNEGTAYTVRQWAILDGVQDDCASAFAYWYTMGKRSDDYPMAYDMWRVLCGAPTVAEANKSLGESASRVKSWGGMSAVEIAKSLSPAGVDICPETMI